MAHVIQSQSYLTGLNISNNNLTRLFQSDDYDYQILSLESLDICENPIADVSHTVYEIQRAFPNIIDLRLNLYDEDHVDLIMRQLPKLQFLNSLPVERDEDSISQVHIVETRPTDQEEEYQYEFSNSSTPIVHDKLPQMIFEDRLKLPTKNLNNQFSQQNIQSQRHLLLQSSRSTREQSKSVSNNEPQELTLNPGDLEQIAQIYDKIRAMHKENNPGNDKRLASEFDNHLKTVMLNLSNALRNDDAPLKERNAEVLKSKYFLYDVCFEKSIQYLQMVSLDQESEIFDQIRQGICSSFIYMSQQVNITDQQKKERDSTPTRATQNLEKQKLQKIIEQQKIEIDKANLYSKNLEERIQRMMEEQNSEREYYRVEKQELQNQIDYLETENKKCIEVLIKHSKDQSQSHLNSNLNTQRDPLNFNNGSTKLLINCDSGNLSSQPSISPLGLNKNRINQISQMSIENQKKPSQKLKYINVPQIQQPLQNRNLTIKQLKELINDIYLCKSKHDEKNCENKQARETMEQFMYTYLNQRYGLKQLIIEWAQAIINGIKKYQKEDNEVCLFGKILRNEVNEEFRLVQLHVKDTVNALLKQFIREKYTHKSEPEINKMYDEIQNDKVNIDNGYWTKIIERMYDDNDVITLKTKIRDTSRNLMREDIQKQLQGNSKSNHAASSISIVSSSSTKHANKPKLTREEQLQLLNQLNDDSNVKVYFSNYMKNVLDFQMSEHERYLKSFIYVFRKVDKDNDGILNENQFKLLMEEINLCNGQDEIRYFLQILDPFNTQKITFSDIIQLFSSHQVSDEIEEDQEQIKLPQNDGNKIPLLERLTKMYGAM
ncbi:UNKNOWN [Stylonychia lemnae]|uniref:EF-hand domain-containing protein n=1 Tax=Stylonychia lemnae TaxID=5949 RepID=A0A078B4Y7_STYLE|nr:UNKNOWN [Stylonychia lemnae]|eukprot:CDW88603.1 UNKNOWN [Stylonychia lemnae]